MSRIQNPEIFYNMRFSDFMRMRKGWFNEWLDDQRSRRRSAYLSVAAQAGKNTPSEFILWPLHGDDKLKEQQREAQEKANKLSLDRDTYRRKRDSQARLKEMFDQRKKKRE